MRTRHLFLTGLCLIPMLAFALFAPSASAADNQAHFNYSYCFTNPDYGYTVCSTDVGAVNSTLTPSGNLVFSGNGTYTVTVTDASGIVATSSATYHYHNLSAYDLTKEYMYHSKFTYSYAGLTCTGQSDFHFVNGEIQFDRYIDSCM